MKKFLTTFALYDDDKKNLYETHVKPRFERYAKLHGLKFIEFNHANFKPKILHPEFGDASRYGPGNLFRENLHFNRWVLFKKLLDDNNINDGDIIYNFDADIFIKEMNEYFEPDKTFSYAIDSGNTHCFGFFVLKINEFSRKLIDNIINRERWLKVSEYDFFTENGNKKTKLHINDQWMYYTCAGIKPHSWISFHDLDNLGFHSYPTEHTVFSLDELKENVNVLPTAWNVTSKFQDTEPNGEPNIYDINRVPKDKIIFRHFASGQLWDFEQYSNQHPL